MNIAEELNQTLDGTAAFRLLAPQGWRRIGISGRS